MGRNKFFWIIEILDNWYPHNQGCTVQLITETIVVYLSVSTVTVKFACSGIEFCVVMH